MTNQKTGQKGEDLAKAFLERAGWKVLETNWRHRRYEIDLICRDENDLLIFVEVKTRSSTAFGEPEDFVSPQQQARLFEAANRYMESIDYGWEIRFDIISIVLQANGSHQLKHIRDAFWPGLG